MHILDGRLIKYDMVTLTNEDGKIRRCQEHGNNSKALRSITIHSEVHLTSQDDKKIVTSTTRHSGYSLVRMATKQSEA